MADEKGATQSSRKSPVLAMRSNFHCSSMVYLSKLLPSQVQFSLPLSVTFFGILFLVYTMKMAY